MSFAEYLRWDGSLAVFTGVALFAFGLAESHQNPGDAVLGAGIMLTGSLIAAAIVSATAVLGLSYLAGFWLTYMDFGGGPSESAPSRSAPAQPR